ncbi:AsmA-like C-terminal region-containing protein [Roseomonas sp. NAR14]|uniref:AsmA-like C-terminal region-containing protein n=2 Tax=Roseomonas acroporae TaxID=2937791 RepID=A0A9X1YAW5_9PROT|nr:AsmA-like C-terminal region-containing protein [Roseomonas acroporae]
MLGPGVAGWLGEGSLSLVASLSGTSNGLATENFDLVAGGLRARGQLALGWGGERPRLTGKVVAERLPLPPWRWRSAEPLGLDRLGLLDAELALEAGEIALAEDAPLTGMAGSLRLAGGVLRLDNLRGQLGGGALQGSLQIDGTAARPRLALDGRLEGATLPAPLFGLPLDLAGGRADVTLRAAAEGHGTAALLATLGGELRLSARDGVLTGMDLRAAAAASALPQQPAAEAALRRALTEGETAYATLDLLARLADGRATLAEARLTGEGGVAATASGTIDLGRGALDLRIAARPGGGEGGEGSPPPDPAPDLGLRVTGPAAGPRRIPEISAWARWRAERG